jgi:hypothetical protein
MATKRKVEMYSPKIREHLIPKIYRAAKKADVPMTVWINEAIEEALSNRQEDEGEGTKKTILKRRRKSHGARAD